MREKEAVREDDERDANELEEGEGVVEAVELNGGQSTPFSGLRH